MEADVLTDSGENNDGTFSFEDSDRFDEMSLCSWVSDPESICGDWRGWKRSGSNNEPSLSKNGEQDVEKLIELCAKVVAVSVSFENVEKFCPNLPEELQLRIAFWSFPRSDDNIRLYSCLANGSAEEFSKGEQLYRGKAVVEPLQIGFHLNGSVLPYNHGMVASNSNIEQARSQKAAVVFDRGHVTSCMCTCSPSAAWCSHIVALCLHRIYQPQSIVLRPPVSESLSRLQRNQLQKFAQYLISELPQELLPYAQKLLDQLLMSNDSEINTALGAPDPTAGPSAENKNQWRMDEKALRDNVRKMLSKFCGPGPFVLEEAYNLQFASTAPPTAAEWSNLLRPLTSHDPEGMWNLLSIVRELFQHRDPNAIELLQLLTQECLSFEQIVVWWLNSRSQNAGTRRQSFKKNDHDNYKSNINTASTEMTKHACASFCDELVVLWRLACLDPALTSSERMQLKKRLEQWHTKTIEKAKNARYLGEQIFAFGRGIENFPGFKIAIEACSIEWSFVMLASLTGQSSARQILCDEVSGNTSNAQYEVKCITELDEDIHTLCTRAEALQVHGYPEGSQIAEYVTEKILADARVTHDVADNNERRAEDANCFIKTSVVQASFLCSVLYQDPNKHHLAFKIGVHGLEVPRQPATSKALEVKLTNQETELVSLLNKLPLGPKELDVVRERAQLLCQGKLDQAKTVLPIKLAIFLFQVLAKGSKTSEADKELGFKTGLTALNMKADILEIEYPMLCEGMRRQRGELAIALLDFAKDNATYLQQVKECLLDRKRHRLEAHFSGNRRSNSNQKRKTNTRNKAGGNRRGGFGQSGKRQSSNDDDDRSRAFPENKPTTSKSISSSSVKLSGLTDSSGSRQSSWSSCFSDDLSQDDFRATRAPDSGRDSDNDPHYPIGHSSRDKYSEGEISADHSPGEEVSARRLGRGNSGLIGAERDISGSSGISKSLHEGASNVPIDIPHDDSRNPTGKKDNEKSIPQNDESESNAPQSSHLNNIRQDEAQNRIPQDDDGWVESDGWNESHNPISQNDHHSNIPNNANQENGDRKYRKNERCDQGRKAKRNKKKGRSYHDNRSLEAEAHFTFELAKKVLMLAGGATPSPNSIFGQAEPTNNVTQSICNRSLQLCAFELGLFALGLHNTTCFNWLSRTYSAHVSWISTQALELGNVALAILLEKWKGHLTPSEVASISDRASKSNDQVTIQKASQLALACLSMAHTLNAGYIRSCLIQCKEQGTELLEQACRAVESAAHGGGVYPEVLFEVAKHWEYLYEQSQPQENEQRVAGRRGSHDSRENDPRGTDEERESDESRVSNDGDSRDCHEVQEPHEERWEDESRPRPSGSTHPVPQPFSLRMSRMGLGPHHPQALPYGYSRNYGLFFRLPTPEQLVQQQVSQQVQHLIESYHGGWGQPQVAYQLTNAYQVGMLALENVGRRPVDDQSNSLLAKNPPHKAEIHWLCSIANKVGISALQQFCRACVGSIHSPFVLHELALEAAGLMAKSNPTQIAFHLRSPSLSPMVQKCLMNYAQCVQQSLQNLPKSEYPEFVELVMHARGAYCMAPGGMTQFNDLLQNIRRNTSKKKDLWQKITTGLAHQQK